MTDANPTSEARPAIKAICVDDYPDIRRLLEMAIKGESGTHSSPCFIELMKFWAR